MVGWYLRFLPHFLDEISRGYTILCVIVLLLRSFLLSGWAGGEEGPVSYPRIIIT
jgi:hypothetical protein